MTYFFRITLLALAILALCAGALPAQSKGSSREVKWLGPVETAQIVANSAHRATVIWTSETLGSLTKLLEDAARAKSSDIPPAERAAIFEALVEELDRVFLEEDGIGSLERTYLDGAKTTNRSVQEIWRAKGAFAVADAEDFQNFFQERATELARRLREQQASGKDLSASIRELKRLKRFLDVSALTNSSTAARLETGFDSAIQMLRASQQNLLDSGFELSQLRCSVLAVADILAHEAAMIRLGSYPALDGEFGGIGDSELATGLTELRDALDGLVDEVAIDAPLGETLDADTDAWIGTLLTASPTPSTR